MKTTPRLHLEDELRAGGVIPLSREQAHYLTGVLRLGPGGQVAAFNGRDGEWLCCLAEVSRKGAFLRCQEKTLEAVLPPDVDYCFAPLKHARLDYVVQKATELGVRRLRPVFTDRTIVDRVNLERMRANVSEAAEQCNLVFVPEVVDPVRLGDLLAQWQPDRRLVHCDEAAAHANPLKVLEGLRLPAAVLIGPEGGFTDGERALLRSRPYVTSLSLGPRVMRADTAAVSVLALMQATLGDWH